MPVDPLNRFHAPVAAWFRDVFAEPTVVQQQAWEAISAGENALVVAPTGSGKTLAAFLWSLSKLTAPQSFFDASQPSPSSKVQGGTKVIYISPLKALGVDVDRNLAAPLAGIARTAAAMDAPVAPVRVGVRSGDTPQSERAKLLRHPPEILITTPESLYLMLTSKAAGTLHSVETVIVDEVHAVAGTKRGAHLALSLERLDFIAQQPVQRIGLSATVNPVDTVASFMGGDRPVRIVNPPSYKSWDVTVRSVVEDFQDPPPAEDVGLAQFENTTDPDDGAAGDELEDEALLGPTLIGEGVGGNTQLGAGNRVASGVDKESALPQQKSVWPHVHKAVYEQVMANTSTLVFVNSRRTAERLTGALNEHWAAIHDPESLAAPMRRDPAQLMAQSTRVTGSPAVIARAHHGSVSKEERADIEQALKAGTLKCVVATSSLELGIDMGLVDHVIQVGAPPSVASAIQRCGRAGHSVGETSRATIYPLHKQDAEVATVIVRRLLAGELEPLHVVNNALDVLAQHTVAATAQAPSGRLDVEQWWRAVRRAHAYAALPREAFDGVLELISGRYPSTDFADLKARVIYDAEAGTLEARPGAQRVAVTNGGTIPDRGMFGVFLAAGEEVGARRVGELDEEMVYESRVGDVFTLGASSWKILEINRDQVIVAPAAGHTGRLPFWVGDAEGRPVELGKAIGEHRRAWGKGSSADNRDADFICANTVANLTAFYSQQREDTGVIPDEKTIVVERFRDEIGDWRVIVHTPYGRGVNAPWAMALSAQLQRTTGIDSMAVAGDDGMVLRLPYSEDPPGEELLARDAQAVLGDVMDSVGSSALFAGRFRECAARALLLPRRHPGKRQPLWQQRQRAAQLLDVARNHPDFPIMVETMRECIHDVYKLDELEELVNSLPSLRIAEVTTEGPSAFAESLLFTYTSAFMYEGDSAERAAALAVDPALLAKVLGKSGEGFLLDPVVVSRIVDAAQWRAEGRRAGTVEQSVDMLRALGPLTLDAVAARLENTVAVEQVRELVPRRLAEVSFGGARKLCVVEDIPLLRDGLGVPVPPGVGADPTVIADALDQLVLRMMRHRGPTDAATVAAEFGMGVATAESLLKRWAADRRLEAGVFVEAGAASDKEATTQVKNATQYVDVAMLRRLRQATLAAARGAVEPVTRKTYARFLAQWHGIGSAERLDLPSVLEQLAGLAMPASAWETMVLPARIPDYQPSDLDDLLASGEFVVVGQGTTGAKDSWVTIVPAVLKDYLLAGRGPAAEDVAVEVGIVANQLLEKLRGGGAYLASELAAVTGIGHKELDAALWELFDAGLVAPDSFAALRARLTEAGSSGKQAHRAPRRDRGRGSSSSATGRLRMGRGRFSHAMMSQEAAQRTREARAALNAHSGVPGRWSAVRPVDPSTHGRTSESVDNGVTGAGTRGAGAGGVANVVAFDAGTLDAGAAGTSAAHAGAFDAGTLDAGAAGTSAAYAGAIDAGTLDAGAAGTSAAHAASARAGISTVAAAEVAAVNGEAWIDRYAVVTRGSIVAEKVEGGFAQAYRVLSAWEDSGAVLRGYIIDGLGGAQFAPREVIDALRRTEDGKSSGNADADSQPYVLAAVDPANPFGAALPWPAVQGADDSDVHLSRTAGALVVIRNGELLAYVGRGGKSINVFAIEADLNFGDAEDEVTHAVPWVVEAMAASVKKGRLTPVAIEKINGVPVMEAKLQPWTAAGARLTPKGLTIK
ncbi:DEAD/DEAH box helicase [Corynebacterium auriscanis]|uniref:DEAD/DEAH box helicase n=1 Tax=Corynebacterium auriscanis TaxID=99807 RepID=UPI003CF88DDA